MKNLEWQVTHRVTRKTVLRSVLSAAGVKKCMTTMAQTLTSAVAPQWGRAKNTKNKRWGSAGDDGKGDPFPVQCPPRAFVSILPRLRALAFHRSPFLSPYEKIKGLCGGKREPKDKLYSSTGGVPCKAVSTGSALEHLFGH